MEFNRVKSILKRHLFADKYIEEAYAKIARLREEKQHVQEELDKLRKSYDALGLEVDFNKRQDVYSYSQAGEDRIINYIFLVLNIPSPTYLDIGANSPHYLNNTFLFYSKGSSGVCVEPNPRLFEELKVARERDICLNVGIGINEEKEAPFYLFEHKANGLSTFSKEHATHCESSGVYTVEKILHIPLKKINDIIKDNFDTYPNFLSIDVEGLDYDILAALDSEKYPIEVICAETITYSQNRKEEKLSNIIELMLTKGYFVFADTHINTIFVREDSYKNNR